jgi:DNA-binding Xre family transcriptional regulator
MEGMTVKLFVQDIAKERGFNMASLQREARIPMATIQRYWHGKGQKGDPLKSVDLENLDRLCAALNCEVGDIIKRVQESQEPQA